jgi:hypothetical protein
MRAYMFGVIPICASALPSTAATAASSSVSVRTGRVSWYSAWAMEHILLGGGRILEQALRKWIWNECS